MIRYMLDTNACIGIVNNAPPALRARLLRLVPGEVAMSQIVRYELEFGVCRSSQMARNRANLDQLLRYVQVAEWDVAQSIEAANIRCELMREGRPIGPYDTLIAGDARSRGAVLVTHNVREFERVDGLQVEDWEAL